MCDMRLVSFSWEPIRNDAARSATQHLRTVHVISFHTVSTVLGRISRCQSLISYFTGLRFVTYLGKEPAVVITQGLAIIALTQN